MAIKRLDPFMHPGQNTVKLLARFVSVLERVISLPAFFRSESLNAVAGITCLGNDDKARRELGFSARPLEIGLKETLLHELDLLRR